MDMKASFTAPKPQSQSIRPLELKATKNKELQWLSALLRLSLGSLFISAALTKIPYGISGTVSYYAALFKDSLLPSVLVEAHASAIMFVEFATGLWLLSGFRLALAWKFTGLLLLSLAIGMVFAGKYETAADNYVYALLTGLGLFLSSHDRWVLGKTKDF